MAMPARPPRPGYEPWRDADSAPIPETQRHKPERGRLTMVGRRTDDGSHSTLLLVQEVDGSWLFHGLGAPGVALSRDDTIGLAESILKRARVLPGDPPDPHKICPQCYRARDPR